VSEQTKKRLREIEQENEQKKKKLDVTSYLSDDQKRAQLDKIKKIYANLPKESSEILQTEVLWSPIQKHEVIERVLRSWIGK